MLMETSSLLFLSGLQNQESFCPSFRLWMRSTLDQSPGPPVAPTCRPPGTKHLDVDGPPGTTHLSEVLDVDGPESQQTPLI